MRRGLILGAALLALGAMALAYGVVRVNGYLTAHRQELAAWATQVVGRPVTFDAVRVSLRGGGSARLSGLRIADDPRFGSGDFLTANSAVVTVSLLDALRGALRLRSIVVDAPQLHLARDAAGWNVESLPILQAQLEPPAPLPTTPAAPTTGAPARPPAAPPAFRVGSFELRDGTLTVSDDRRQPVSSLTIDQVDLTLSQAGPAAPLRIEGSAALFGASDSNATVDATLTPGDPPAAAVQLRWEAIQLAPLRRLVPAIAEYDLNGAVGGTLQFAGPLSTLAGASPADILPATTGTIDLRGIGLALPPLPWRVTEMSGSLRLAADATELPTASARLAGIPITIGCRLAPPAAGTAQCRLSATAVDLHPLGAGDGALRDLSIEASATPFAVPLAVRATAKIASGRVRDADFRDLSATASLQGENAAIDSVAATAFGGTVRGSVRCDGATGPQPACQTAVAMQGTQVAAILAGLRSDAAGRVDGRLDADLQLATRGRDLAALRRSASGRGTVRVGDGVLHGLNLAQRVLGALPGVEGAARSGGRAAALLGGSGTHFDRLSATVRLADERIGSDDVVLVADDFSVDASGSVGFAGDLDARGTFRSGAPLVAELTSGIPVVGRLAAATKGLVAVPFTVAGTLADPRVEPDLSAVATDLGRDATKGIEALFGAPDPKRGRPGGVLRQGLDKLFGR